MRSPQQIWLVSGSPWEGRLPRRQNHAISKAAPGTNPRNAQRRCVHPALSLALCAHLQQAVCTGPSVASRKAEIKHGDPSGSRARRSAQTMQRLIHWHECTLDRTSTAHNQGPIHLSEVDRTIPPPLLVSSSPLHTHTRGIVPRVCCWRFCI